MSKIIGRLVDVGLSVEGTRGAGGTPTNWLPKSIISLEDKVVKARSALSYGNINLEGNQAPVAQRYAQGNIEFDFLDQTIGLFLQALIGTRDTSGPSDSAYTHEFSLQNNNQHDSLAVHVHEDQIGDLSFRLAMIESMQIRIVPDDVVKCIVTFMSRHSATAGDQEQSYSAENKFLGRHLTFKIANTTSGLGAASNIPVRSLTLNIEKNLRLVHNTGSVEPEDILNQGFRIYGEVELDYEGRTYADLMNDGSYRAVRISLTNTEATVGGGSTNPSFTLDLSRVDFDSWESDRPNDEIVSQSFNFTGMYDLTNGDIINACTLVNAHDGSNYA